MADMNWILDVLFFKLLSYSRCQHPLATRATRPHAAIAEPSRLGLLPVLQCRLDGSLDLTAL